MAGGHQWGVLFCKEPVLSPPANPAAFNATLFARDPVGLAVSPALLLPNLAHRGCLRLISHNTLQPFSIPDGKADNGSLPCEGPVS